MRVGFAGAHRTGKTTLIEAVAAQLPSFEVVNEPYHLLEDEGHEFSDPPSRDDFDQQLRVATEIARSCAPDALLDRTPLDFVAYLQSLDDDEVELDDLRDAMAAFDLIVFVPIEQPDRISLAASEDPQWRHQVNDLIRRLVVEDALELGIRAVEVTGDLDARANQVVRALVSA